MQSPQLETPVGTLLKTVFTSILQVFLLCLAGYVLAGQGTLDKKTQKQLNHLNVSLFTPCLLFSKVAFFLSPDKLRELWIIPIFFVLVTVVSMLVSFLLGWIFHLKRTQRNFAMAAGTFMNSNSLPIALMQSLVVTVPGLKWGKNDDKNAMVSRALTYLVLYSTLCMMLRWSYGVRLLSHAIVEYETIKPPNEINERSPLLSSFDQGYPPEQRDSDFPSPTSGTKNADSDLSSTLVRNPNMWPPHTHHRTKFYNSVSDSSIQPKERLPSITTDGLYVGSSTSAVPTPLTSDSDLDGSTIRSSLPAHIHLPCHSREPSESFEPRFLSFLRCSGRRISRGWTVLNASMTMPLWACLASLFVALVRPVQHALESHMQAVMGAVDAAGDCSIPVTLVILGAYFYPPPKDAEEERRERTSTTVRTPSSLTGSVRKVFNFQKPRHQEGSTEQMEPGETKTVIIAIASRMIIAPMLLLPLMALPTKYHIQRVFDDPVFVVSNILLISSPSALHLAQVTVSSDAFERLISRTIFWSYCIVTPPATIAYVIIGLFITKL